jgi:hypothetical protein
MFYSKKACRSGNIIKIGEGGTSCMSGKAGKLSGVEFEKIAEEIRLKNSKKTLWDKLLVLVVILGFLRISLFIFILIVPVFYFIDRKRKTIRLFYEIDEKNIDRIQKFYDAFDEFKKCKSIWNVFQDKGNALKRENTFIFNSAPSYFKTNVRVPKITVTVSRATLRNVRRTIYFLPDRLLSVQGEFTNFINYRDIQLECMNSGHIETGTVVSDAVVIDHVYKNGEKENFINPKEKKYPVCNYTVLNFNSDTGLHERLQFSRPNLGKPYVRAFNDFVRNMK